MKVAYYGEQAPKSLLPLLVVIVLTWVAICAGVLVFTGGVL